MQVYCRHLIANIIMESVRVTIFAAIAVLLSMLATATAVEAGEGLAII